jgi:hypothetical protein
VHSAFKDFVLICRVGCAGFFLRGLSGVILCVVDICLSFLTPEVTDRTSKGFSQSR